jgi:EAL domain-containing protein (putative c-di-GMP-specific phosphodiesterase class I)
MTITRYYSLHATINVPMGFEFSAETRAATAMNFQHDITTSDLVMEEIRQLLERHGFPVHSLSAGMTEFRVTDEAAGKMLQPIPYTT